MAEEEDVHRGFAAGSGAARIWWVPRRPCVRSCGTAATVRLRPRGGVVRRPRVWAAQQRPTRAAPAWQRPYSLAKEGKARDSIRQRELKWMSAVPIFSWFPRQMIQSALAAAACASAICLSVGAGAPVLMAPWRMCSNQHPLPLTGARRSTAAPPWRLE